MGVAVRPSQSGKLSLPGHVDHGRVERLLGYHLAQASIPTNNIFRTHVGNVFQLNKLEFTILMLVSSNIDVTPKRLSVAMNIPSSNLTLFLDRLEGQHLLSRTRSNEDRRVLHVKLTRSGLALTKKLDVVAGAMEKELLSHLTMAEQAMLFELLRKVAAHRRG